MTPSLAPILEHVPPALLVMFRIGGVAIFGPVLGSPVIPVRVRVFLTVVLGLAAYPIVAAARADQPPLTLELWTLAPLALAELLLGAVIGFFASLPLLAMQAGGLIIGQQMGLGFAQLYNPAMDDESDVVAQMLFFLALASFLAIGGHEAMLVSVLHSFERVPLGGFAMDTSVLELGAGMLNSALELGLRVAAPLLCLIFLETAAMGFLARTVPQLNILSLGFPLRILVGLFIVCAGLVVMNEVSIAGMHDAMSEIMHWIEGKRPNV